MMGVTWSRKGMVGAGCDGLRSTAAAMALMTGLALLSGPALAEQGAPSAAASERAVTVDIPAQDLNGALLGFARAAGLQLFYDVEMVAGLRSAALKGSVTPAEGLSRLLAGTGLSYRFTGSNTVALDRPAQGDGALTLGPVTVEGRGTVPPQAEIGNLPPEYAGGQVARGAKLGMLGNRDVMDTPFNVTSYTSELMRNQQARTLADVMENDPSVRFTTPAGHVQENLRVRGFPLLSNEMAFNGVYGIAPLGHVPTDFLERAEVLKGPNALLSGMSPGGSIGGTVNLVPKRAVDAPVTDVTGDFTSPGQAGAHVDFGRRFGTDGRVGVRANVAYRDGESGVDGESKESRLGALALDYRGDDLRLSLDGYNTRIRFEGGSPMNVGFLSTATSVPDAPDSDTNAFRGIFGEQMNTAFLARGEYDVFKDLTAHVALGRMIQRQSGFITSTHLRNVNAAGTTSSTLTTARRDFTDSTTFEVGARGRFETGPVGHEVVATYTSLEQDGGFRSANSATFASNIYAPVTPRLAAVPSDAPRNSWLLLTSYALADTLSVAGDKVQLTLGGRMQSVNNKAFSTAAATLGNETSNYDDSVFTPAVGLVVKPFGDSVSFYANYIEGLTQGGRVTDATATNYGQTFAPYVSKQKEAGVKWDAGKIANTLSVFEITQQNTIIKNGTTYEPGEQRNRGVEWNVFGEVVESVRVLGGVTYIEGEQTKTANGTNTGKVAYGTPEWQANIGAEWDTPFLRGLTLEGRIVYTGSQYVNSSNTLSIPDWTRFDAGARYVMQVYDRDVTVRGYVTNLLDKDYWAGSFADGYVTQSEPRTYGLSATVGF